MVGSDGQYVHAARDSLGQRRRNDEAAIGHPRKEEDAVVTLNPDLVCKLLGNCEDELDFAFDHKIPIG